MRPRARTRGFTLIEIMVSLAVVIIGLLGIMALQTTTVRANRLARNLDRARVYAEQVMEDVRGKNMQTTPVLPYPQTIHTPDNVDYVLDCNIAGVTGSSTLVLVTATATFNDPFDGSPHSATVQLIRTNTGETT
jgi:type IV pilus modification protein PilV